MWLKYLFITILLVFFAILQNSFLSYFSVMGAAPNLVFILFFACIFFEANQRDGMVFFLAIIAGFLLDIFSPWYLGSSIVLLLAVYGMLKLFWHYLGKSTQDYSLRYFVLTFSAAFLLYTGLLSGLSLILNVSANLSWTIFVALGYNVVFAVIMFYLYKNLAKEDMLSNQLRLFR